MARLIDSAVLAGVASLLSPSQAGAPWEREDEHMQELAAKYGQSHRLHVHEEYHPLKPSARDYKLHTRMSERNEVSIPQMQLGSLDDPDFGFFNQFLFEGEGVDDNDSDELVSDPQSYLQEIFSPIGNPGDPPQRKQESNNRFSRMAGLMP
mgnify:CR=1 FL=1